MKNEKKLEDKGYAGGTYVLKRGYYLSDDEYAEKARSFLDDQTYSIRATMPDGDEVFFTLQDVLNKGKWDHPDVVTYDICKNRKTENE